MLKKNKVYNYIKLYKGTLDPHIYVGKMYIVCVSGWSEFVKNTHHIKIITKKTEINRNLFFIENL